VTPKHLNSLSDLTVDDLRLSAMQYDAIVTLWAERDQLLALAHRVHAEWMPISGRSHESCDLCGATSDLPERVIHQPNCLWLTADELLWKVGEV
jgi:hypothetical protein